MASVIKSTDPLEHDAVLYLFDDVITRRVDKAQDDASAILDEARRRADEMYQGAELAAQESAADEAEQRLQQRLSEKIDTLIPALQSAAAQLADARQTWLRHWERVAVDLSAKIAERIVRQKIKKSPKITLNLVREALEMAAGSPRITVRMNPADYESLGEHAERIAAEVAGAAATDVVRDKNVSPGGCRVETKHGVIDQQIETQLARIIDELTADS